MKRERPDGPKPKESRGAVPIEEIKLSRDAVRAAEAVSGRSMRSTVELLAPNTRADTDTT